MGEKKIEKKKEKKKRTSNKATNPFSVHVNMLIKFHFSLIKYIVSFKTFLFHTTDSK